MRQSTGLRLPPQGRHGRMLQGAAFLAIRRKMTAPPRFRLFVLALLTVVFALVAPTRAQTPDSARAQIEAVRAALIDIDSAFKNGSLTEAELQRLRGECDPLAGILQGVID